MRRFYFDRQTDVSGTSGTGAVVEGVQFSDGSVSVHWMTRLSSWSLYRNIAECIQIHGHDGATNLVWVDEQHSMPDGPTGNQPRRGQRRGPATRPPRPPRKKP